MINSEKIESRIKELKLSKEAVCAGLGISLNSLNNKLHGRTAFTVQEARDLSCILHFTQKETVDIFFGTSSQNVNKEKPNG